ncbi:hypothetical protein DPMN_028788 [Dreissena polymorpha]|uniref:Uncharacterized protein n=1 Tax=Dreissena polymorpha TaxID=45954 RepID=A0A9D4LVB8_DREPO|nr:hypothetical protein DPMN_028788 [Dreissena polymorpha]
MITFQEAAQPLTFATRNNIRGRSTYPCSLQLAYLPICVSPSLYYILSVTEPAQYSACLNGGIFPLNLKKFQLETRYMS